MADAAWYPFEERAWYGFVDEVPRACYLGKICLCLEGRNAFFGCWSCRYAGYSAFHADFERARLWVEERRVKGSTWTIRELPVLVISGPSRSLVVGCVDSYSWQFNHYSWESSAPQPEMVGLSLEQIGQHYLRRPLEPFALLCPVSMVAPAILPYQSHSSMSAGGGYALSWSSKRLPSEPLKPFLAHLTALSLLLQEGKGSDSDK